ncbi:MAG: HDIG domain-containing protein [Elusimicrobiota bacterium]|jgi:putative nucleotidyltransferase with HDIG domain|nr:HDIG domain-containing protein [Elusimicrobiota bacterium]
MSYSIELIKLKIRQALLLAAKSLKKSKLQAPALREKKNFFRREIKVPVFISCLFASIILYAMLVLSLGVGNKNVIILFFGINYKIMFAVTIFIVLCVILFAMSCRSKLEKTILQDPDAVVLLCFLFVISVLVVRIAKNYFSIFVAPMPAFSLMAAMLLSLKIGILYAVLTSIFCAILDDMKFDIFLVILCSSLIAIINYIKITKRSDFIMSGIKISAMGIVTTSMFFLFNYYDGLSFKTNIFYSVINGPVSAALLLIFMPFLEKTFSRTTNIKLIELSNFDNPLLKKLMLEAPGTYHHSLTVATIAERATDAIGENPLLARAAAYYHDVGKINNPQYFVENQNTKDNPHDVLTPSMSSLILISHVKDGIVLAKEYKIDKAISDIIEQHHGNSLMLYFYNKALEADDNTEPRNFRYPGRKPQTKISLIVMLSDACEAACRTIDEPTPVRISEMVSKIVESKFSDNQFDDCPITLKELTIIKENIVTVLTGIYHGRIEYKETADEK